MKILKCEHCGNMITFIKDAGVIPECCGIAMKEVVINDSDGAVEKHLPVIEANGREVKIQVGSVLHPSTVEHHIEWIVLQTNLGMMRRMISPGKEPVALFTLQNGEQVIAAYEYCNLHGFWKTIK